MATLIKEDGTETTIEPANGKSFSMEELQAAVDGYFEQKVGKITVFMNEEGTVNGMKINKLATQKLREMASPKRTNV